MASGRKSGHTSRQKSGHASGRQSRRRVGKRPSGHASGHVSGKSGKRPSGHASGKRRLPAPTPGALSRHGDYRVGDSAEKRRRVLARDVAANGYATTIRELNLIAVLDKNRAPAAAATIRGDMAWLKAHRK